MYKIYSETKTLGFKLSSRSGEKSFNGLGTTVEPAMIFTNNFENNCHIMTVARKTL